MRLYRSAPARRRETVGQLGIEPARRQIHRTLARDHEVIHTRRQCRTALPEKLPYLPFDPIADHRVANLTANGDAHAGFGMIAGLADNDKIFGVDLVTGSRKPQKFGSFSQAGRLRERLLTLQRLPPRLGARPLGRH